MILRPFTKERCAFKGCKRRAVSWAWFPHPELDEVDVDVCLIHAWQNRTWPQRLGLDRLGFNRFWRWVAPAIAIAAWLYLH